MGVNARVHAAVSLYCVTGTMLSMSSGKPYRRNAMGKSGARRGHSEIIKMVRDTRGKERRPLVVGDGFWFLGLSEKNVNKTKGWYYRNNERSCVAPHDHAQSVPYGTKIVCHCLWKQCIEYKIQLS